MEFTELQQFMIEVLYDEWYIAQWSNYVWGMFSYLCRLEGI
jgi:hypothetical protein